ncbi:zinc finger, CCHC-type containing protein [Tanacetum coccineum]
MKKLQEKGNVISIMEKVFFNGRRVKEKEINGKSGSNSAIKNVTQVADFNNVHTSNATTNVAVNMDTSSLDEKICDMERKMLEGKLVFVDDNGVLLKPLNVDQPTAMEPFHCLSDTFGTPKSSTKDTIVGTNDTTSVKGQEVKDRFIVAVSLLDKPGYTRFAIRLEYKWTPPRCGSCNIFGHTDVECLKNIVVPMPNLTVNRDQNDGFKEVKQRGPNCNKFDHVHVTKKMACWPIAKKGKKNKASTSKANSNDAVDLGHNVNEVQQINEHTSLTNAQPVVTSTQRWKERKDDNIFTMRQWCSNNFPQAKEQLEHLYNEVVGYDELGSGKELGDTLEAKRWMTFGVQKHGGPKQVGFKQLGHKQVEFKQLGPGVKTGVHGVQDEKRVWFEVKLRGSQGNREAEVFQISNDDAAVAQRWGNAAEKKKVKESMEANLEKLLKYNAWSTRWSPVRGITEDFDYLELPAVTSVKQIKE